MPTDTDCGGSDGQPIRGAGRRPPKDDLAQTCTFTSISLEAITVPLLAIYGGDDRVVPVTDSIEALRRRVPEHLLEVRVLPGGDHRVQRSGTEQLVDGYSESLLSFIDARVSVALPVSRARRG